MVRIDRETDHAAEQHIAERRGLESGLVHVGRILIAVLAAREVPRKLERSERIRLQTVGRLVVARSDLLTAA